MSDQSTSAAPEELATPAIAGDGNETETTTELETAIGEAGSETTETNAEELDDLEFAFGKYRVPKKLKTAVEDLQATFTQKTQEYSSKASELEAREARLAEQSKVSDEEIATRVHLSNIDAALGKYRAYTEAQWAELKEANYEAWNEHRLNIISLENAQREAKGKLSEHETKRTQSAEQDHATRVKQTQAFAQKLPGWKPELDKQVVEFALAKGFTGEEINRNMSPAIYDVLRLARIGEEVLKKQAAKPAPGLPALKPEPLEMVGAKKNPPPAGLSDDLSDDEWYRRRNKQLAAKAN